LFGISPIEFVVQDAAMKIDLYTKFILTVIAGCLICFVFRDVEIVSSAHAEEPAGKIMPVNIAQVNGRSFVTLGMPVQVVNPVRVTNLP
jgi:hypothetical protein